MQIAERSQYLIYGLVLFALLVIFTLKLAGSFDVVLNVLYVPVVVYCARFLTKAGILCVGLISGGLCATSFLLGAAPGSDGAAIGEFAVIMLAIATTTWFVSTPRRLQPPVSTSIIMPGAQAGKKPCQVVARYRPGRDLDTAVVYQIRQPLSAAEIHAHAGLRWLNRSQPDVDRARESLAHIIAHSKRSIWLMEDLDARMSRAPDVKSFLASKLHSVRH